MTGARIARTPAARSPERRPLSTRIATAVLAATLATQAVARSEAPDGERGFSGTTVSEMLAALRSTSARDQAFVADLKALEGEVRILLTLASRTYESAGHFRLLSSDDSGASGASGSSGEARDDLDALWRAESPEAFAILGAGDERALVFARLFCDVEFRLRVRISEDWEADARDLRAGLAFLAGTSEGFVDLRVTEVAEFTRRVDLAAARLRVLRADLKLLHERTGRESDAGGAQASDDASELLALFEREPPASRKAAFERHVERIRRRVERLGETLESPGFLQRVQSEFQRRRDLEVLAAEHEREVRQLLPDMPEGLTAPPDLVELSPSKRYAFAARAALAGLNLDLFNEDLNYLAGHATSYQYGEQAARKWFDRFLRLRGIRSHDSQTIQMRELTPPEERALDIVGR